MAGAPHIPLRDLPVLGNNLTWQAFVERRTALTAQMEMETCNGCDGCGLRCMNGFTVTREEWEAVREYLRSQPGTEVERIRAQEKEVPWPGAEDTGATVTYCPFRDMENGNCSIYPVRPTVCRLFGHTRWLPCPIEAVTQIPEGSEAIWKDYTSFERHTFAEWGQCEHGAQGG